jgi:hypothetical protein
VSVVELRSANYLTNDNAAEGDGAGSARLCAEGVVPQRHCGDGRVHDMSGQG